MDKELLRDRIVFGVIAIIAIVILTWAIHTLFLLTWNQAFATLILAIALFGMAVFMAEI